MLDWTGERFVPWAREPALAYEHLHRYIWASSLVKGKRVLDLASGEGYGAGMLARHAAFVCGVDIDEAAIRHASERYNRPNLQFLRGSLTQIPISGGAAFDLIVCFEALEHIREHDELMREVKRLLKPEGLFIVSTPNKEAYREDQPPNPFHVRELTFAEFNGLLTRYFSSVRYFGQSVHPGSSMWPIGTADGSSVQEFTVDYVNDEFQPLATDKRAAVYLIAVASDVGGRDWQGSVLLDHSDELFNARDRESKTLREQLQQREEALEWRESCVHELEKTVAARDGALAQQAKQLDELKAELSAIRKSRGWKFVLRVRALKAWCGL